MKKIFLTVTLIASVIVSAMMLSAFTKLETTKDNSNSTVTSENENCSFQVIEANPSISGTTVTITVKVKPAFKPTKEGEYPVVVKPTGNLRNILNSQAQYCHFYYTGSRWQHNTLTVEFKCDVHDNTYNQCSAQDFEVTCFKYR
ncbi:MAG: hypothetical protein IJ180_09035 [Bacteroidales bacterium]|nr:hypothetical protein [Bacteroidales bacterium]